MKRSIEDDSQKILTEIISVQEQGNVDGNHENQEIILRSTVARELIPGEVWVKIFQIINHKQDISNVFCLKVVCKRWNDILIDFPITVGTINNPKYFSTPWYDSLTIETFIILL